jgi:hypothetical protein
MWVLWLYVIFNGDCHQEQVGYYQTGNLLVVTTDEMTFEAKICQQPLLPHEYHYYTDGKIYYAVQETIYPVIRIQISRFTITKKQVKSIDTIILTSLPCGR